MIPRTRLRNADRSGSDPAEDFQALRASAFHFSQYVCHEWTCAVPLSTF